MSSCPWTNMASCSDLPKQGHLSPALLAKRAYGRVRPWNFSSCLLCHSSTRHEEGQVSRVKSLMLKTQLQRPPDLTAWFLCGDLRENKLSLGEADAELRHNV